jgi:radical SAM superfamily enzyme YgiQ (UPF0313 family)
MRVILGAMLQVVLWSGVMITIRVALREFARQCIAAWAVFSGKKVLNIVIIKSSRYDSEDGFVWRNWKAILPSNTQATIYSLVRDIQANWRLGMKTRIITREYDETVQDVNPARIARLCKTFSAQTLVMVVGAQTNEFARASDIVLDFQERGVQAIIGGFHVSGVLKVFPRDGSELSRRAHKEMGLDRLTDNGVSLFAGEVEGKMLKLLQDFMSGRLQRVYDYLSDPPDLTDELVPEPVWSIRHHFVFPGSSTVDTCRGCPFKCKYCTIKNVQGRKIRARGVPVFVDGIRRNWRQGINAYFVTSDNASRDPLWRERFKAQIAMREQEGIETGFMVQVDTQCHKIQGFIPQAAAAGCNAAFIGLETVNPDNLLEVDKRQNRVGEYQDLNDTLREHGIAVQYGYMIGLPHDTYDSVVRDVDTLIELEPDLTTFFIATPLPGADDHKEFFKAGVAMNSDLNTYDCFSRVVMDHPLMSREELLRAYQYAWQKMYSVENMVRILKNNPREYYWRRFWSMTWYKYALEVAERHPMITGFVRMRSRHSRRKTFPQMSWIRFQLYNLRENIRMWRKTLSLGKTMIETWLQSRQRSETEQRISNLVASRGGRWVSLRVADLKEVYRAQGLKVPRVSQLISQMITARTTRQDIEENWTTLKYKVSRGKIWELLRPNSIRFVMTDVCLHLLFVKELLAGSRTNI